MSVTAARLGSSPLLMDWSNLLRPAKSATTAPGAGELFLKTWVKLEERFTSGEIGFYDSVRSPELSSIEPAEKLARELLESGRFTDALFLGIGGSSLGPLSMLAALRHRVQDRIRIRFLENPDPIEWRLTLKELDPARTLVVCVTKSGTTFETMAQFLLALEWLGIERWKTHTVAITDPTRGDLRSFAQTSGIPCLDIHPSIGGRFSVFSPVGTFPGVLAGLDMSEFLKGAMQIRDFQERSTADAKACDKNPFFQIGADLIAHAEHGTVKRPIHVVMPYATGLKQFGAWFVQLWAESLGKDGKGFTPLSALGAVDQHSILQLLRDGPDDKVTFFLGVDEVPDEVRIPHLNRMRGYGKAETPGAFRILEGHSLHSLLRIEHQATALVMTKRNRPHFTWRIERMDERNIGALYFASCVLTSFTGALWGVNPFDQPGVEEAKVYIRESLGRKAAERKPENDDENSPVARLRTYANRPPSDE